MTMADKLRQMDASERKNEECICRWGAIHRQYSRKGDFYLVRNDKGEYLERFDTLADAALVVRYIGGGNLPESEALRAIEIMNQRRQDK